MTKKIMAVSTAIILATVAAALWPSFIATAQISPRPTAGGGGSAYPPMPLSNAYQYDDLLEGGDCTINLSNLGKHGWRVASNNGGETVSCSVAMTSERPGVITIGTGNTANNEVALWQPAGSFNAASTFTSRFLFRISSTTTSQALVGLVNGPWQISGGTVNGLYFEKESADTNWFATSELASARTRVNTGVAAGTGWMAGQIRRIDSSTVGFKLASTVGGLASATEATITTNIPTVGLIPGFMMRNTATGTRELDFDFYDVRITGLAR